MKKAAILEDLTYIEQKLTRMMQIVRTEKERIETGWSEHTTASPTFTNPLRSSVLKVREAAEAVEEFD